MPPLSRLEHPRELVRQFTPNWFTAVMGTGILAVAPARLPDASPWLRNAGDALWRIDIVIFLLCCLLYAARWLFYFNEAKRIFRHGVMSMFLGAIPMGLATLINGLLVYGPASWGAETVPWAIALWRLDCGLALLVACAVPFLMFTRQTHQLEDMTAVWLLPLVAPEVAAATGGLLLAALPPGPEARSILTICYSLWGMSMLPALGVLVILFLRMVLHRIPGRDMAVSSWLAIGPVGTGALALLQLGAQTPRLLAGTALDSVGPLAHGLGVVGAFVLWGYGCWWLTIAMLTTLRYLRDGLPFNMGWWAFTFPVGVFALATLALARETGLGWMGEAGRLLVMMLAGFWLLVTTRTLHGVYHGHLFVSPCLRMALPADEPA